MTVYLDYSATTPVLPEVADLVYTMMVEEYGNAGSRTHEYGVNAKRAVELARHQVAAVVKADKTEVIFTSGATESNNLAILGLREFAENAGKKHIITSKIEHKAVLEPIAHLEAQGFDVTYLDVTPNGLIDTAQLKRSLREDTVLVSIMHINNETGVIQPIDEVCQLLSEHNAYLHVDAAQSFGKYPFNLENTRIDFISVSGHKLYAPKGIGALIMRRRGYLKSPLRPLYYGGGQEKGLRPGTLATPLIAGLGLASELSTKNADKWIKHVSVLKNDFIAAVTELGAVVNGSNTSPYVLNFSIPGVNSEAAMVQLKGIIAISNGSACTSNKYSPSHVLVAMGLDAEQIDGAIRVSFGAHTQQIPYEEIQKQLGALL
ncbi:cysteine desulfurase DndA [Pectobacterium quasiaquaticum]|uniref:cysteine desulfurase n=1 Tax=Pectobacterium quasiaquaticum TaxID=2774015 RepID=A0A9Q2II15_9GAMM|nr:cysteine desulfurase DndA [Pectobacterium quasiaquaticum]MBE5204388.1 cysteine desulfurase DndA [Pectobacterium quasiaquaticum]MBE5210580.1 cysteine desulfurase DndA [Pectobacterium quasiaquaticum]MBE5223567.1 cysteine desulfurase DndA [Pectobacterium quasiaquaticum]URG50289.1 cysteine desulfurase DndA [Pectobacterium quasiaquaticum]URG54066.1 cysteine desulfurase DndA [Pectobacterium quasiaquaticum]